ncbi:hypothetical protein [Paractinoplanes hotanensis]|uniref:Uncharacterized protein n=1 Tax=Paractinoplanes hotanensis TaxID=2906497 RepID=A0ABT0YFL3_9ACTN|nr:hypothetical protein [Actinoplanes hotanensis]MCM4084303.1 hypothetical protein [Actinoplanes hotanensis]
MIPVTQVGAEHDHALDVAHASAMVGNGVRPGRDALFQQASPDRTEPAAGQTMSAEVFQQFWDALGDQDELIHVHVEGEIVGSGGGR